MFLNKWKSCLFQLLNDFTGHFLSSFLSVMQVLGAVPSLGGLLDDYALIGCYSLSDSSLKKKFRYFVLDSSVIMAMLEQPQGPEDG